MLYEGSRLRLIRSNGTLIRVDVETGERVEILPSEIDGRLFHLVGNSVYLFSEQGLVLWDPAAGYQKVTGVPAGGGLSTNRTMIANGYAFFATSSGELYRIREGERHLERMSSAPVGGSFSSNREGNLLRFYGQGQSQWSIDGITWRPGPEQDRFVHLNGTVLQVQTPSSENRYEVSVLRWNEAAYDWQEAARLPYPRGYYSHTRLSAAANSSHFCVVVGTRAFFSTDGSGWDWQDLPVSSISSLNVFDDQFVVGAEHGFSHVTRDGTAWTEANGDLMAWSRTSWLSVGRNDRIARADGTRFPLPPLVAIRGGRVKSAPASWEIITSADVPAAHLYSELWINGRFAQLQTGDHPRFHVEQQLPGLLDAEVRSFYSGDLTLRPVPFQLLTSAKAESELQFAFRSENGDPRTIAPPGAHWSLDIFTTEK